jgi:hypothetical protein
MPFGMGFGELVLIAIIVLVVFSSKELPSLGDALERWLRAEQSFDHALSPPEQRPWTQQEWALVTVVVALTAVLVASLLQR